MAGACKADAFITPNFPIVYIIIYPPVLIVQSGVKYCERSAATRLVSLLDYLYAKRKTYRKTNNEFGDRPRVLDYISTGGAGGTVTITFSGEAMCRRPHYIFIISGQIDPTGPLTVSFRGKTGGYTGITGVAISDTMSGQIATNGTSIVYNKSIGGGWGFAILINLYPNDEATYTVTYQA